MMPATLPSVRARLQLGIPHALTWNQGKKEKNTLPERFTLQRNSKGVRGLLLSRSGAVISLVVKSACLCGSCCFPGHWAQGIYTELVSSNRGGSTSHVRPSLALMSSLMMGAMSSGGLSLHQGDGPPSPPSVLSLHLVLSVCVEQHPEGLLSLWVTFSLLLHLSCSGWSAAMYIHFLTDDSGLFSSPHQCPAFFSLDLHL